MFALFNGLSDFLITSGYAALVPNTFAFDRNRTTDLRYAVIDAIYVEACMGIFKMASQQYNSNSSIGFT